ncbi:hypothetical protein [Enterococcus termitis]|uniref:hypothetical protein n=1 Tax=Enterococcus termitis TaxID=332950 RepID=UPI001112F5E2|nr:hypothetical protein [Enterococcus termitis]
MTSIPYRGMLFYCKSQRLLAELMMRNTWRENRAKFHSFKDTATACRADVAQYLANEESEVSFV